MGTTLPIDDSERIELGRRRANADAAARWAEEAGRRARVVHLGERSIHARRAPQASRSTCA